MSETLERRYRWLLRAYPKGYRNERGAEMIGTLMEAAGADQRRPTAREAASLMLRGLQARAGVHRARSVGQSWLGALRLAALLLLAYAAASGLAETGRVVPRTIDRGVEFPPQLLYPLGMVVTVLALIAVAAGRYVWGLLATFGALATALLAEYLTMAGQDIMTGELHYQPVSAVLDVAILETTFWPLPLALLLIVPLVSKRPPGTRRPLAWLLAPLVAVLLLPTDYEVTIGVQPWAALAVMVAFLLWVPVDARAAVAASMLLLPLILQPLAIYARYGEGSPDVLGGGWFWTFVAGTVALLACGVLGLRRQARI